MPALGEDGLSTARLARTAFELGRARAVQDRALAALAGESVRVHPAGFVRLGLAPLRRAPDELRLRLFGAAIAAVSGAEAPPRAEDLQRSWSALTSRTARARTLGGCLLKPWGGQLYVYREAAAVGAPLALKPGTRGRWDGRFAVTAGRLDSP